VPGYVRVERREDVALVRVDRPPANALDLELLAEGRAVLDELMAAAPGAVVLTGRDGFFSAGVDLKLVPTLDAERQRGMVEGINRLFLGWYAFPRPLVCAVNGHAIAGGLILALCGDYRVGSTQGKLGLTELKAGVPYPAAAIAVVRAELPAPAARSLALRAHLVDPDEACRLGLVDELCDPDNVLERALVVAGEMGRLPSAAYARTKQELRGPTIAAIERALDEGDPLLDAWVAPESREAAATILARRE
jgi:enoyl-CoA hydratase